VASTGTRTTNTSTRTGIDALEDGENREVEGSGKNPHKVSRRGHVYSCSCPAWKFQKTNIALRTCKHIRQIVGDTADAARIAGAAGDFASADGGGAAAGGAASADAAGGIVALPFKSVMLANKYIEEKHGSTLAGEWWVSEKLDGLRAVWDGTKFMSRAGNLFFAPDEFVKDFPTNIVLDGELFCGRGNFDKASSLVRSYGGTYAQWNGSVTYQVFDAPLLTGPFEHRMKELKAVVSKMKHATFVAQELLQGAAHLVEKLASIEADDGEGLMLRKKGSAYEFKRSNSLLKVKTMHDAEAVVTGHEEGKGKNKGKCGAMVCELPSGKKFKVGTGLTDVDRANPPPVGSTITFGYFEMTKAGVPRFPTFKRMFAGN
jgi:DNA ligase-1